MRREFALTVGLLSLLAACSESNTAGSATSTPAAPATTSSGTQSAPPAAGCPVGDWQVATITGKSGTEVNGIPVVAKSGGGFTLSLTSAGTWTLKGDNASVVLEAGGISVDATVNGTAEGDYAKVGSDYQFRQQSATGKATLKKPVGGVSSFSMDQVGPSLAPGGKAALTCGPGSLQVSSESVVLDLTGAGGAAPPPPATPSGGGAGAVTITDSAQTRTIDCAGRDVAINGSSNKLTFTGSCGTVSINGSKNELGIAAVSQISVNGSLNKITYRGQPKISNNGTGNTISRG